MPTPPNLTPPANLSRSSSPGAGEPKSRVVSGSLRDRIARFENPSAAPLLPTHAFGTAGPAHPSSSVRSGLIGNRLPSLDPKTAGMVGGARKVSENRGLIGNRIPSVVGSTQKAASSGGRSASPAGSVDSSTASGAVESSHSPVTSRASSPPTSPGLGLPPSLLSATLPDNGGPGAMTPSSTRADAGEETLEMSVPSTPIQAPTAPTSGHYDLVAPNLKLAGGETLNPARHALNRGLSTQSNAGSVVAPSMGSSRVSQYDPGSQGSENPASMMRDVSGISTPTSTPKAERRELEGSVRDEGSVVGEGELDDLGRRLEGLGIDNVEVVSTEHTNGEHDKAPPHDSPSAHEGEIIKAGEVDGKVVVGERNEADDDQQEDVATPSVELKVDLGARHPNDMTDPSAPSQEQAKEDIPIESDEKIDDIAGHPLDEDPNQASDLDALKAGDLERERTPSGTHTVDQNPVNNIAEAGAVQGFDEQVVMPHEMKQQGGVAGQRMEDIEKPTSIEPPKEQAEEDDTYDEMDIHTATDPSQTQSQSAKTAKGQPKDQMPDIIEGSGAAGIRLDDATDAGAGPMTSGETDELKDLLVKRRTKEAEREGLNQGQEKDLQTEEDRDEGVSRKAQLIKALDQNKDVDADMQEETDEARREKAHAVTAAMTKEQRDEEAENDEQTKPDEEEREEGGHKEKGQEEQHDEEQSKARGDGNVGNKEEEQTKHGSKGTSGETNKEENKEEDEEENNDHAQSTSAPNAAPQDRSEEDVGPVVEEPSSEATESTDSVEDVTTSKDQFDDALGTAPSPATDSGGEPTTKPLQVQIEPAPIAQTIDETETSKSGADEQIEASPDKSKTGDSASNPTSPTFPTPPQDDPDVVDRNPATVDEPESTEPIDSNVLKSFPDVPDEEKPRVEVHVSQPPVSSPHKNSNTDAPETPLAKIPGKSKSLSHSDLSDRAGSQTPEHGRRDSLDVDATPTDKMNKSTKRLSTRRSPKSPLLDDEDPGDFEHGEGWAVVTKGRDD